MHSRRDERREPDVFRIPRNPPRGEARDVIHTQGPPPKYVPLKRRASVGGIETRIPGPFWSKQRADERREVDALRKRKFETFCEARDVIHRGGANVRDVDRRLSPNYPSRRRPATGSSTRIPGPFWLRRRPDERREVDALRRRKFDTYYEAREVIHGEGAGGSRPEGRQRRHPLDIPAKCRPKTTSRIPGPFWMRQRRDERRDPDMLRRRKCGDRDYDARDRLEGSNDVPCGPCSLDPFWLHERRDERRDPDFMTRRKFGRDRIQAAEIVHGEDFRAKWYPSVDQGEDGGRREAVSLDYPGTDPYERREPRSLMELPGQGGADPFWMQERDDERRDPDFSSRRKAGRERIEAAEIVHGDDFRNQWYPSVDQDDRREPMSMIDLPTGGAEPFWMNEREDERRDPDFLARKKFGRERNQAAEIVHGDDFRAQWYPSVDYRDDEAGPSGLGPSSMPVMARYDDSSDDDAEPYNYRIPYKCDPPHPESGPDPWMREKEFGHRSLDIPQDVQDAIENWPAGRMSCAPQSDIAQYDQPNTFMRKLYEKYPYLYHILQETPPEELASKVFKDRFLSTYQVDFLHLGVGEDRSLDVRREREIYVGPNGEPESSTIPGCSYRRGDKGERTERTERQERGGDRTERGERERPDKKSKKDKEKEKEEEKERADDEEDGPPVSEYMATISRLGEEIVQDQLYKVAEITKNMKNEYKKM